jgi:hypothetical protein
MKPESPTPNLTPEQLPPVVMPNVEKAPILNNPEAGIESGADAYEKRSDLSAIRADVSLTTVLPTPVVNDVTQNNTTVADDNPAVANDDDLIEKEWVDKAKRIVAETQDDPHKRDEEVNKLQVDYLKKRFGREIGVAE